MTPLLGTELAERGVAPDCIQTIELARDVLARVGDRWTLWTITVLAPRPLRFTALHERVTGISQRMLSQTLRALTRDGLVTRTAYPQVPPRVEYALTPLGRSLHEAANGLVQWVRDHQADIVGNRDTFDQTLPTNTATAPHA
ncbi:helix-turn-helix domain-containing protein [Micromonospora sp. WMMD1082]|uniref:winged helix-turn-helix transcriptional regulator n=1 Tax=Micromonospora sp. WMMD1082 TaxID=3016104 RepID=UPI0024171B99|nr:helix-turn-helix domain-containing protein [Micromonospora sp. WMMD1082]MDG4795852.1 helix-turn-helix domain-containing protein [Micromonospora sp. WMMD1082]